MQIKLILILSLLCCIFAGISYRLYADKAVAVAQLKTANETVERYKKDAELKDLSCKIDADSSVKVNEENKNLQSKADAISDKFEKLRRNTASKLSTNQEIIKNETNVLPDDGLLSPNVAKLLQDGWCETFPTDNQCLPK